MLVVDSMSRINLKLIFVSVLDFYLARDDSFVRQINIEKWDAVQVFNWSL